MISTQNKILLKLHFISFFFPLADNVCNIWNLYMGVFDTQRANKNHFAIKYEDETKTKMKMKNKTIEQTRLMKIIKINQIHQNASPKIYVISLYI